MHDDSTRPYFWMLSGGAFFACMMTLTNASAAYFPWQFVAMARSAIPFLIVLFWAISAGAPLVVWRPGILWVRSISGSVSLVSTFYALSLLPAPEVNTIANMFPLWVAILSWPLLREMPPLATWIGVFCAVAGILLMHPPNWHEFTLEDWPALIAVFASFSTAFAMIGLNRLKHLDNRAVVVHFSFTALVFSCGSYFLFDRPEPPRSPTLWAIVMLLGTGVTATVGQMFLTKAFTAGRAANVAIVNIAQIPMTLALQMLFFDYRLTPNKLLGMTLVAAPTAWFLLKK